MSREDGLLSVRSNEVVCDGERETRRRVIGGVNGVGLNKGSELVACAVPQLAHATRPA